MNGVRNDRRSSLVEFLTHVLSAVTGIGLGLGFALAGTAAENGIEGDPFNGRKLFVDKRCVQCHSVWGHGGSLGPEIVRVVARKSLPDLAGAFWNHTPRMIEEMTARGYNWPVIDRKEMADILSYLYYLRLFDDPGDPSRGAAYYTSLGCEACHALGGRGGDAGVPLDRFGAYGSPVPLAQAMWNAGPAMRQSQVDTGTPIPRFVADEMVDVQAYIRERGSGSDADGAKLLSLPDPARGERIFLEKGCSVCHVTGRSGAPDLGEAALRLTVGRISSVLWNHGFAMQDRMRSAGVPFPQFADQELADLVSYLYFVGYRGGLGDAARGAEVYRSKGCAVCHEEQQIPAPDLVDTHSRDDAIGLSAAMWNHAPQMHEQMAEYGIPWPKFEEGEMENLVAHLRESRQAAAK
jgi:cytochrome c2